MDVRECVCVWLFFDFFFSRGLNDSRNSWHKSQYSTSHNRVYLDIMLLRTVRLRVAAGAAKPGPAIGQVNLCSFN